MRGRTREEGREGGRVELKELSDAEEVWEWEREGGRAVKVEREIGEGEKNAGQRERVRIELRELSDVEEVWDWERRG